MNLELNKKEELKEVMESSMIVDKENRKRIDVSMLMSLYQHYSYGDKNDVVIDGGKPQKLKIRIFITEEEI